MKQNYSNTLPPEHASLKTLINDTLEDLKAQDIQSLYIGDISSIADDMIVASGTSKRHVQSMAESIVENCKQQSHKVLSVEGIETGEWVLVDLGDIIVHIMQTETRAFYDLEKLWNFRPVSLVESDPLSTESLSSA